MFASTLFVWAFWLEFLKEEYFRARIIWLAHTAFLHFWAADVCLLNCVAALVAGYGPAFADLAAVLGAAALWHEKIPP